MNENIVIRGVGIHYPKENIVTYEDVEKHFAGTGIRIKSLMKILGKERCFYVNPGTDFFDFASVAVNNALENASMDANEIDIFVVCADIPEYISPSNALKLAKKTQIKNAKVVYDINANCAGNVVAIDQVSRYLLGNPHFKKAMIVNVFMDTGASDENEPISYATFSDSSSALILEKVEAEEKRGFIDCWYKTDYQYDMMDVFPNNGFRAMFNKSRDLKDGALSMNRELNLDFIPDVWFELIDELLKKNGLNQHDVKKYIFTQFSLYHIISTLAKFGLSKDCSIYTGDLYGYNGSCSDVFSLNYGLKNHLLSKDDYTVIVGIGAGYTSAAVLYKFDGEEQAY